MGGTFPNSMVYLFVSRSISIVTGTFSLYVFFNKSSFVGQQGYHITAAVLGRES
jgi:hypothetical protein